MNAQFEKGGKIKPDLTGFNPEAAAIDMTNDLSGAPLAEPMPATNDGPVSPSILPPIDGPQDTNHAEYD